MSDYFCRCNNIIEVPPKRIIALIGDTNMTTSLLHGIANERRAGGGTIEFGEQFYEKIKKQPWKIQLVPDDIVCYTDLRVKDFLRGITTKYDNSEEKERLLQFFDIDPEEMLLDMTFEKNRSVAMIASLMARPELLLLDRPYDMLSSGMYKKWIAEMVKVFFSGGSVIITAEHYEDIGVLCSDYIFLENGNVVKHYYGKKKIPKPVKVVTIWGCTSMPSGFEMQPLCKKGNCLRFLYDKGDLRVLAAYLSRVICENYCVEEVSVDEQVYGNFERWML